MKDKITIGHIIHQFNDTISSYLNRIPEIQFDTTSFQENPEFV